MSDPTDTLHSFDRAGPIFPATLNLLVVPGRGLVAPAHWLGDSMAIGIAQRALNEAARRGIAGPVVVVGVGDGKVTWRPAAPGDLAAWDLPWSTHEEPP